MQNLLKILGIDSHIISFEKFFEIDHYVVEEFSTKNMKILRQGNKQWMLNIVESGWRCQALPDLKN